MKKILFFLLAICLTGAACEKKEPTENYPKEVSFMEYSLVGTSCQWANLNYDDNVIVINSEEELNNYIACTDSSYPVIDFSKYTLLLANGLSQNNVEEIKNIIFSKNAENEYTLTIIIHLGVERIIDQWNVSVLIPKTTKESIIRLDVYQSQFINE